MRNLLIFCTLLLQFSISAQEVVSVNNDKDSVLSFTIVESVPVAKGCDEKQSNEVLKACFQQYMLSLVSSEFQFPPEALRLGIQAKIYINFVLEKDGSISNVELARSAADQYKRGSKEEQELALALDNEAVRVVRLVEVVRPAIQKDKPVRMSFTLPINAKLN